MGKCRLPVITDICQIRLPINSSRLSVPHSCPSTRQSDPMDFTELYKQTASLVAFSPGAHFLLYASQDRAIVRRTDTFQITRSWLVDATPSQTQDLLFPSTSQRPPAAAPTPATPADGWITHLAWSCDSEYVLAACSKRGFVQLLKLRDEEWSGRIDSGAEGDRLSHLTAGGLNSRRPCES